MFSSLNWEHDWKSLVQQVLEQQRENTAVSLMGREEMYANIFRKESGVTNRVGYSSQEAPGITFLHLNH